VLAATGISDHEEFCDKVAEAFSKFDDATTETAYPPPILDLPSFYTGGESRVPAESPFAHVALAFDASSCSPVMQNVVKQCLNISGIGMGVSAFVAEGGLVGVYSSGEVAGIDMISKALTSSMMLTDEIVLKAKECAKVEELFSMECFGDSKSLASLLTKSVLSQSSTKLAGVVSSYDSISTRDVQEALGTILKTKPSLATIGNTSSVPYVEEIASRLSS